MPDVTSPVSDGTWVFTVNSGGELQSFETKTGAKVWQKDLETVVQASPAIFGRRLYVICTNGTTIVAAVGADIANSPATTSAKKSTPRPRSPAAECTCAERSICSA